MTALSRAGSGGCAAQPTLALLMASLKRSPPWKRASTNHPFPLWLRSTTVHDGTSDPDLGLRRLSGHLQHFPQPRDELFDAYRGPGQRLHPIDDLVEAGERIGREGAKPPDLNRRLHVGVAIEQLSNSRV